jgi:von Willebrand factor type D domain
VIEAILEDTLTPYLAPDLRSETLSDSSVILATAVIIYRQWWDVNRELSLESLQSLSHPLAGAEVFWPPQILPISSRFRRLEVEEPDSSTPITSNSWIQPDGPDAGTAPDRYSFQFVSNPTPYNCLAWAMGETDRWVQPAGPGFSNWKDILNDYGFDTTLSVNCAGQCPIATGPKIMMIFHSTTGSVTPTDNDWIHAIKQEADGDWTSKNGMGSRYKDIADYGAFLDRYYLAGPDVLETTVCYCKRQSSDVPTPTPTPRPTQSTPAPNPTPRPTQSTPAPNLCPTQSGFWSGVFGDPHLSTFDRLRFDCQAAGEFTMVTSLESPNFKIQERFTSVGSNECSQASVSTAIAVAEENIPTVQISIPRGNSSGSELVGGCPVDLFVDGNLKLLSSGTGRVDVDITVSGLNITIFYPGSLLKVLASARQSTNFGCFLLVQVFKPCGYRSDETIIGLLGKPNLKPQDDWVAPNGTSLSPPQDEEDSIFSSAYNYCTSNWCVRNAVDSIFTYRSDESFAAIFGCDEDYGEEIETAVANAGSDLVAICGDDLICLVDGICGDLNDAQTVLQDEEIVVEQQQGNCGRLFDQQQLDINHCGDCECLIYASFTGENISFFFGVYRHSL